MATYKLRVVERTDDSGVIRLTCIDEGDATIYTSPSTGGAPGATTPPVLGLGSTLLEVLDIPLLSEDDDRPGIYIAAGSVQTSWPGCAIYRSTDAGATYAEAAVIQQRAVIGYTDTKLAPWYGGNVLDCSYVDVQVHGGTLSSTTFAGMLDGANRAVIGDEVLQFQTATLIGTRTYRLSGFLRGRLGTDDEMQTHASGERFVLLDSAVTRIDSPLSLAGRDVIYRAVTLGNISTAGAEEEITETQAALKPLAPAALAVGYSASAGYTATWARQTRYQAPWLDGADAPIAEQSLRYRVLVAFGNNVYLDTEVATETATFGAGADLTYYAVQIQQISDVIGYGFPATATIE